MKKNLFSKSAVSIAIICAMTFGGAAGAHAAAAPPMGASVVVSPSSAIAQAAQGSSSSGTGTTGTSPASGRLAPGGTPGLAGNVATPAAFPIAVRLAVKAGMQVLKRTNVKWYNAIRAQLGKGRTAFANWWNKSVPSGIKKVVYGATGGVGINALYDAILWTFGL